MSNDELAVAISMLAVALTVFAGPIADLWLRVDGWRARRRWDRLVAARRTRERS